MSVTTQTKSSPRGRSSRRKPLMLGSDLPYSDLAEAADPAASTSSPNSSLSLGEKTVLQDFSHDFASSLYQVSRTPNKYSKFSNALALQLEAEAEARGYPSREHDYREQALLTKDQGSPRSSETPSLSSSSRSDSEDSFLLQDHLPSFYADATPHGSSTTLTTLDVTTADDKPWVDQQEEVTPPLQADHSQPAPASGEEHYDEEDSRMLSLPLKVCAYALALLPIPTSLLASRSRTQSPPPLPVEVHHSPKTYQPRHRTSNGPSLPSSPLDSTFSLPSLSSAASPKKNYKRKVCFDRVVVITSPSESDEELPEHD